MITASIIVLALALVGHLADERRRLIHWLRRAQLKYQVVIN